MTAFMLACYMNGVASGATKEVLNQDCTFYTEYLSNQTYDTATGENMEYNCICKLVPRVDEKKVRVY